MREKCCLALITFSMRGDFMNTKLLTSILQSSNDLITSEDFLTRPFAYLGRTCDAHLGSHDGMRTYFIVVGYLDQIVQLYSAMNNGCSHGCTVDASIGADFYIVFQDNNTDLGGRTLAATSSSNSQMSL